MATEIIMPAVSTSMTEGVLARWVKNEGDAVTKGEVVAEIETDKAVLELEAESDGILGRKFVTDGATVGVGVAMGVIVAPGEPIPEVNQSSAAPILQEPESAAPTTSLLPAKTSDTIGHTDGKRIFASPLARNIARQNGIDLSTITGSGPRGRIIKQDVEATTSSSKSNVSSTTQTETQSKNTAQPQQIASNFVEVPHTSMRRVIAQRLSESKQQVPHFYLSIDCQLDSLLSLRQQINGACTDIKVSVNDFVLKAVAGALVKVPAANASWTDTAVRVFNTVDLSVAVATPNGLITPIIRNAETKSLGTISREVKELAERAKQGKLRPDEYQGGGFSISNLGMFGVRDFAAIINPPQACILAVGAGEARAVVKDGAIIAATVMTCTLSVDHRVVDGAVGAEFLSCFKALIEAPLNLLV